MNGERLTFNGERVSEGIIFHTERRGKVNGKVKSQNGKLSTPSVALLLVAPVSGGQSVTTDNTAPADRPTSQWKLFPSEGTEAHQCFF